MTPSRWVVGGLVAVGLVVLAGAGAAVVVTRQPTPAVALPAPRFVDVTGASGVDHTYGGDFEASIGGGLAVLDCDTDGLADLYLAGGDHAAALYRNETTPGKGIRFARTDSPVTSIDGVMGAYPLDVDGDGAGDLVVLRAGGVAVLRGVGDCAFEDVTASLGLAGLDGWFTAFSATWEADARLPTIALGRYLALDATGESTYDCAPNALLRPRADGTGYDAPLTLEPGYCSLSMLFSDWDGSGRRDLRVSNDRQYYDFQLGEEQLWRIEPGAAPRRYTADDGWVQLQVWGMGIASHDLTGDGLPEVYLTSQGDNKLQTLASGPAQPMYRDIALKRGVLGTRPVYGDDPLPSTAWHPAFEDVNNDGFIDLFVTKGNVAQQQGYATRDPANLYLGRPDGTFTDEAGAAGLVDFERGRGAALVDLDRDGLLDLVEVRLDAPVRVMHNPGAGTGSDAAQMGTWVGIRPHQAGPNPDAIGAIIEVRVGDAVLREEVVAGGGHISGALGPLHVGLGQATRAAVRVTWLDGTQGPWLDVDAGTTVVVDRDPARATPLGAAGG